MSKRLRVKKYKQRYLDLLKKIKSEFKVNVISINQGDSPFGECSFEMKELKDWRFSIWLSKDNMTVFGDHKSLVRDSRFKPRYTYLNEPIRSDEDFIRLMAFFKSVKNEPERIYKKAKHYSDIATFLI